MEGLPAVIYPFVTRAQLHTIKVAAIYFDEVYVPTPVSIIQQREFKEHYIALAKRLTAKYGDAFGAIQADGPAMRHESFRATMRMQREAKPLIDAGVIHVVNPFNEMKSLDMQNEFRRIIAHRAKLATEDRELRAPRRHEAVFHVVSLAGNFNDFVSPSETLLEVSEDTIRRIMFDLAVLIGLKFAAVPVTSEPEFYGQFTSQAISRRPVRSSSLPWALAHDDELRTVTKAHDVFKQSIAETVPLFDGIDFGDILSLRSHCQDELIAFRQHLRKLTRSIAAQPGDIDYVRGVCEAVRGEVTPIVLALERRIRLSKEKWAQRFLEKATSVGTVVSFLASVCLGVPLHYGLLAASGIAGLQATVETHFDVKELKCANGLSFLLNLRRSSGSR